MGAFDSGMGSEIHVASYHLGAALALGRVLIVPRGGDSAWVTGGMWDPDTGLYRPLSKCTEDDAAHHNSVRGQGGGPNGHGQEPNDLSAVPPTALMWLQESDTAQGQGTSMHRSRYWWRAQATTYMMRFPDRHLATLLEMRTGGVPLRTVGPAVVGFPLPRGSISMHIRHGDKGSEMRLVPAAEYYAAAKKLVYENPNGYTGTSERARADTA